MKIRSISGNNITATLKTKGKATQTKKTPKTLSNDTQSKISKIQEQVNRNKTTISQATKKIKEAIKNDGQPPKINKRKQHKINEEIADIKERANYNLNQIEQKIYDIQNQANNALSKPVSVRGGATDDQITKERDKRVAKLQSDYQAELKDRDQKIEAAKQK